MAIGKRKQTCFVVMPFGEKKDADGQDIDFDDIYRFFFRKAIESLGLECIRCDEIAEGGSIHEKMFEYLYKADVVVVDITSLNANVFYELGIRHTLQRSVTVLIRRKGTMIPFNIQGLQVVEYDQKKFGSIEKAKERILDIIKNGLKESKNDSPVHAILKLNIGTELKPKSETEKLNYPLDKNKAKSICLITGEIQNVKDIDIWVNPENTEMLMSRPLDNAISGIIRHLGIEREDGKPDRDAVADELKEKMGNRNSVEASGILVTEPGNLRNTNNVKKIFHVAAYIGQFGKGYSPIPDVHVCVEVALKEAEKVVGNDIKPPLSILFTLMGTGIANQDFDVRVRDLLESAINYLDENPDSKVGIVYFLNYSEKEYEACQRILNLNPKVATAGELIPVNEVNVNTTAEPESISMILPSLEETPAGSQATMPLLQGVKK